VPKYFEVYCTMPSCWTCTVIVALVLKDINQDTAHCTLLLYICSESQQH